MAGRSRAGCCGSSQAKSFAGPQLGCCRRGAQITAPPPCGVRGGQGARGGVRGGGARGGGRGGGRGKGLRGPPAGMRRGARTDPPPPLRGGGGRKVGGGGAPPRGPRPPPSREGGEPLVAGLPTD